RDGISIFFLRRLAAPAWVVGQFGGSWQECLSADVAIGRIISKTGKVCLMVGSPAERALRSRHGAGISLASASIRRATSCEGKDESNRSRMQVATLGRLSVGPARCQAGAQFTAQAAGH